MNIFKGFLISSIAMTTFVGTDLRFWCKNKVKENKAYIFLTGSYFMLQVQTIDGRILSDFG
ncbi:hypothetical protein EXW34_27845 (plasmid) [Bacillus mycoides]|nr:hypothetical protein IKO_05243 [Bacillus cereus VDM034]QWI25069.1 hypothetical protein EXW34_27845 [Bacillus mycoides]